MSNLIPRREEFFFPIEQAFDRFFDSFFTDRPLDKVKAAGFFPKMDMYEVDDSFVVKAATAGMSPADISVEVDKDNYLTISGKYDGEPDVVGKAYYRKELTQSKFARKVPLPQNVIGEPEAVMKNGILTLTWKLDKPQEQPPKRISIRHEV